MTVLRDATLRVGIEVPARWHVRIKKQDGSNEATPAGEERGGAIIQAATFALPAGMGDYGGGAVEWMASTDIFLAVVEFGTESLGAALFSRRGRPRVVGSDFDRLRLQRVIPGQSGAQHFFAEEGRAWGLYVVLGSHTRRFGLAQEADDVVRALDLR